nr:hypothetical protein [uncultured Flavobacterium sp.]
MGSDNEYEHQSEWVIHEIPIKYNPSGGIKYAGLDLDVITEQMSGIDKLMEAYENASNKSNKTNKP